MSLFGERLTIDGYKLDARIEGRIIGATLVRSMESAASLELTLDDDDLEILRGGILTNPARVNSKQRKLQNFDQAAWARFGTMRLVLDGAFFRLAGAQFSYTQKPFSMVLTFEDEIASEMRRDKRAIKVARGLPRGDETGPLHGTTLSDFMHMLIRPAERRLGLPISFFSPEGEQQQKIKQPEQPERQRGLGSKTLYIAGAKATTEQRKNITIALTVADDLKANELAHLAMLVAGIGESSFIAQMNKGGSKYGGVFQGNVGDGVWDINDTKGMSESFLKGGKGFQAGGAISQSTKDPDQTPGEIAYQVEGDLSNFGGDTEKARVFYDQHLDEAKAILDAWGGASGSATLIRQRYSYRAGGNAEGREDYWAASGWWADKVRWRRFAEQNTLWFVNDEWLFSRKPTFKIAIGGEGVLGISATADVGIPVSELTTQALTGRWAGPAGCVGETIDMGPLTANWLLWEHRQDLLSESDGLCESEMTWRRPAPAIAEEAPATKVVTVGPADAPGDLAYPLAVKGKFLGGPNVPGSTHYPGQNWQSCNAVDIGVPVGTVVYAIEDGVISPTGTQFNGFGPQGGGRFAGLRLHLKASAGSRAWFYGHLESFADGIQPGARVNKGDPIGKSGSANGVAHLHLAVGPSRSFNPKKLLGL